MATYECKKCGMSVDATCGKCGEPLQDDQLHIDDGCLLYTSPSPRD